jgi:hypothetical protein
MKKLEKMIKKKREHKPNSFNPSPIPKLINYGIFIFSNFKGQDEKKTEVTDTLAGFYVMPKYECNLDEYIDKQKKIDVDFILKTASMVIDALDLVHLTGFTFNDLKP